MATPLMRSLPLSVVIGSDHAGFAMKQEILQYLQTLKEVTVQDVGCYATDRCDYPEFGKLVGQKVSKDIDEPIPTTLGIVVCGSGIGISISANKVDGVRCALCHDHYTAKMSRLHNNANVLALGGRTLGLDVAKEMVDVFLRTPFSLDERHTQRVKMIHRIEKC